MVTKVIFLTKYSPRGASSRYRFYNYQSYFENSEINVEYSPLFGDSYLKYLYSRNKILTIFFAMYYIIRRMVVLIFNVHKYDHAVIEAELFPHFSFEFDHFFLRKMKSFSLDYDDNIAANYQNTKNATKIKKLIKLANFVTVGNHWYFSEFEGNLIYLPTVIDLEKYPIYDFQNEKLELVWIGSPSTSKYLSILNDTLVKLSKKYDLTLKIIGGSINLDNRIKVINIPWSAKTENKELAESTLGIMPLDNTYWEKGKCGFKLIQYMASGLPVIGSKLPANEEIIEDGKNGFIASGTEDWLKHLEFLINNPDVCKEMGATSRKRVENHYCYQVWGPKYVNIVKENV